MLVLNLPDYVGLLDFGVLEHCGSGFCKAVTDSMKSAVGFWTVGKGRHGVFASIGSLMAGIQSYSAWIFFLFDQHEHT